MRATNSSRINPSSADVLCRYDIGNRCLTIPLLPKEEPPGSFVWALVLTAIASGWTVCVPLLVREALRARRTPNAEVRVAAVPDGAHVNALVFLVLTILFAIEVQRAMALPTRALLFASLWVLGVHILALRLRCQARLLEQAGSTPRAIYDCGERAAGDRAGAVRGSVDGLIGVRGAMAAKEVSPLRVEHSPPRAGGLVIPRLPSRQNRAVISPPPRLPAAIIAGASRASTRARPLRLPAL